MTNVSYMSLNYPSIINKSPSHLIHVQAKTHLAKLHNIYTNLKNYKSYIECTQYEW